MSFWILWPIATVRTTPRGISTLALLTEKREASAAPVQEAPEVDLAALMAENAALKEELTARRAEQQQTYVPKPLDLSEYKTRKLYIDTMLTDAGWTEGKDWLNEVELPVCQISPRSAMQTTCSAVMTAALGGGGGQAHLRGRS